MNIYTKAQTKKIISDYGYTATFTGNGDEIEIRRRGDKFPGYFTDDRADAIQTAKHLATCDFTERLQTLPGIVDGRPILQETCDALRRWFASYGVKWADELHRAWMTGNYNRNNDSGTLQALRNVNGHEVVRILTK
jgi:hypothetical protein